MPRRVINSIKYKRDDSVSVNYLIYKDGQSEPDSITMTCRDKPLKDLEEALQALVPEAALLIDIREPDWHEGVEIRGVVFGWKHDIMGARLNVVKTKSDGRKFCYLTPFEVAEAYNEDDDSGTGVMSEAMIEKLENVLIQANKYIEGERAQGNLFANAEADEEQELEDQETARVDADGMAAAGAE